MSSYDPDFPAYFIKVIALPALVGVCIAALWYLVLLLVPTSSTAGSSRIDALIHPVAAVHVAGNAQAAAAPSAAAAAAAAAAPADADDDAGSSAVAGAFGDTMDPEVIYNNSCNVCHDPGLAGAPTLDHEHWDARIAQGMDTVIRHAIEGFMGETGMMPARGGNPAITDAQMEVTVRWMVDNLK